MRRGARGWFRLLLFAALGVFLLIQLVPYGRDHADPPVTAEPAWDSPETRQLVAASCMDCHGNETVWPWYSNIAPISWLTQRDVDEGRIALNFSEWDMPQSEAEEIVDSIVDGEMPPWTYTLTHPGARLSPVEEQQLIDGLRATLRTSPPVGGEGEEDHEGD